ncbi:hypothetical protein [Sanguibacter suarezii]|uniref:hypothetical protein n=1 Tax=Sanguibacter suarezii TaxID=60921 RepID=UPI0008347A2F|nr:hypothetical protein [Sanguibacter suarezii]
MTDLDAVRTLWSQTWPQALTAWGRFTRLRPPRLLPEATGSQEPLRDSLAWFNLLDVEVSVNLETIIRAGVHEHALAILAHEIGHHILAPGDLLTAGRMAVRARLGLQERDMHSALVTNLWADMLINDRLQTRAHVDVAAVYRTLDTSADPVMRLVLRACEILWSLPAGDLAGPGPHPEAEALLISRLVRAYAADPVGGVGGFALVLRPFLPLAAAVEVPWCAHHESIGTPVPGLATDPTITRDPLHPALDPRVMGSAVLAEAEDSAPVGTAPAQGSGSSTLSPADYSAVLASLGVGTTPRAAAHAWYREHASQHLVPFPVRHDDAAPEDLLGGHDAWDVGDDLADVDWSATVLASPQVIPGMTTRRRHYEQEQGTQTEAVPVDLDIYLDSSGSMPDPVRTGAPIALAGAILALSALRVGARVQATTWSGQHQIAGTGGFTRDSEAVLAAIVAHFGGGTSFPLHLLERTHLSQTSTTSSPGGGRRRPCHIAVISDEGVVTMFTNGRSHLPASFDPGSTPAARAVRAAGGGGTLVLNVPDAARYRQMAPGYDVYAVRTWDDMVGFARSFARTLWGRS